jgi:MerR family copper efflux transcriptional regulator
MKIGQVAKQAGVGVETIRFYERKGLLAQPPRIHDAYREYTKEAVANIRFIKRAKDLGFTLSEIAELLALETTPHATCADVKHRAVAKIAAIQQRLNDLHTMKRALGRLVASCNENGPIDNCPIFECFGTSNPKEDSR